jgi:predicted regulator of Ras-like GTPase activity (Roadblock/LC7/MglB family)
LVATLEIGQMMGSQRGCNLIVQEHEGQSVLVSRVGVEMLLLMATDQEVSLGWSRLAVRRTADHIAGVIGILAA